MPVSHENPYASSSAINIEQAHQGPENESSSIQQDDALYQHESPRIQQDDALYLAFVDINLDEEADAHSVVDEIFDSQLGLAGKDAQTNAICISVLNINALAANRIGARTRALLETFSTRHRSESSGIMESMTVGLAGEQRISRFYVKFQASDPDAVTTEFLNGLEKRLGEPDKDEERQIQKLSGLGKSYDLDDLINLFEEDEGNWKLAIEPENAVEAPIELDNDALKTQINTTCRNLLFDAIETQTEETASKWLKTFLDAAPSQWLEDYLERKEQRLQLHAGNYSSKFKQTLVIEQKKWASWFKRMIEPSESIGLLPQPFKVEVKLILESLMQIFPEADLDCNANWILERELTRIKDAVTYFSFFDIFCDMEHNKGYINQNKYNQQLGLSANNYYLGPVKIEILQWNTAVQEYLRAQWNMINIALSEVSVGIDHQLCDEEGIAVCLEALLKNLDIIYEPGIQLEDHYGDVLYEHTKTKITNVVGALMQEKAAYLDFEGQPDHIPALLRQYLEQPLGVHYLRQTNLNVHVLNREGETLLHSAVKQNKHELVRVLLERGANPFYLSKDKSPFSLSIELLKKGDENQSVEEIYKKLRTVEFFLYCGLDQILIEQDPNLLQWQQKVQGLVDIVTNYLQSYIHQYRALEGDSSLQKAKRWFTSPDKNRGHEIEACYLSIMASSKHFDTVGLSKFLGDLSKAAHRNWLTNWSRLHKPLERALKGLHDINQYSLQESFIAYNQKRGQKVLEAHNREEEDSVKTKQAQKYKEQLAEHTKKTESGRRALELSFTKKFEEQEKINTKRTEALLEKIETSKEENKEIKEENKEIKEELSEIKELFATLVANHQTPAAQSTYNNRASFFDYGKAQELTLPEGVATEPQESKMDSILNTSV